MLRCAAVTMPSARRRALALMCLVIAVMATACSGGRGGGGGVRVTMLDFRFDPLHITARADQELTFTNSGSVTHNFTILHVQDPVNLDVAAGKSASTEAIGTSLKPGDYELICKYHAASHGMIGV